MNSSKRIVQKQKTSIFLHKDTLDNVLNEQLAALSLLQQKPQEIDFRLETRKAELLEEMHWYELESNHQINEQGYQQLLREIRKTNSQKLKTIEQLKLQPNLTISKLQDFNFSEQISKQTESEQQDIKKQLEHNIQEIQQSIRIIQKQNNLINEQLQLYNNIYQKLQLKEIGNNNQLDSIQDFIKANQNNIKIENIWQQEQLDDLLDTYNNYEDLLKKELEDLCQQEEKIVHSNQSFMETNIFIQQLDVEIEQKFHKIEKCAELLEEFDDLDKLYLIFVMENPTNFELEDILQSLKQQLIQPQSRLQLANSIQEYIDRARFSGVSSRIKIFYKFHNNNLNESINSLIQVYRNLQIQDTTLKNRYTDLLFQKQQLLQYKEQLNQKNDTIYQFQTNILVESLHNTIQNLNIIENRHMNFNKEFFIHIFLMLTTTLSRMMNALLNIKEILKSCNSNDFEHEFYLKWTYNRMFIHLHQVFQQLEKKYKINLIAKDPSVRTSNQFLNAIYDNIEDRIWKDKTIKIDQQQQYLEQIFPQLSIESKQKIKHFIQQDIFLQIFFKINDINQLIENQSIVFSEEEIIELIKTKCYTIAHQEMRNSTYQLIRIISDIIIESSCISQSQSSHYIVKKYRIQDIINKHQNNYEYKIKEWKKEVLHNKIKQIEHNDDDDNIEDDRITQNETYNHKSTYTNITIPSIREIKINKKQSIQQPQFIDKPKNIRKYLNMLENLMPKISFQQTNESIFNNLSQNQKKFKCNKKINIQTQNIVPKTFTLQSLDSSTKLHSQSNLFGYSQPQLPQIQLNKSHTIIKTPIINNKIKPRIIKNQKIIKNNIEQNLEQKKIEKSQSVTFTYEKSNQKMAQFFSTKKNKFI